MGTGRYPDAKSGTIIATIAIAAMLAMSAAALALNNNPYSSFQFQDANATNETEDETVGDVGNISENETEDNVTAIPISTNITGENETTDDEMNETEETDRRDTYSVQFSVASLIFPEGGDRTVGEPNVTNETNTTDAEIIINETDEGNMTEPENTTIGQNTTSNLTAYQVNDGENELPYIISGQGGLSVADGMVENFDMMFDMVHTDGTERHTHEVTGFHHRSGATMDEEGSVVIRGVSNISTDGNPAWSDVDTTIIINEENAVSVFFSPGSTNNHFESQAVMGIVDSLEEGTNVSTNETVDVNETDGSVDNETETGDNTTGGLNGEENETEGGVIVDTEGNETVSGETNVFQNIWISIVNFFTGNASDNQANTQVNANTEANINSVPQQ